MKNIPWFLQVASQSDPSHGKGNGWYPTSLLDEKSTIRMCQGRGMKKCYPQMRSHNDLQPVEAAFEELGVYEGLFCRVDRAGTDDDEDAVVVVRDDGSAGMVCSGNRQAGLSRGPDLCSGEVSMLYRE